MAISVGTGKLKATRFCFNWEFLQDLFVLSNVLLTAAPAIVIILFHTFGAFRIVVILL